MYKMQIIIEHKSSKRLKACIQDILTLESRTHATYVSRNLKIYSSIPLKKTAFCLKTSHFINKCDSPRSQLCQWPRLVHNCNQSFNMSQPSVYFDSHPNIPTSHLGIPGGVENLDLQY